MKYALVAAFFAFFGCVGIAAGVSIFLPGFDDGRAFLLVLGAPLMFGVAAIVVLTRVRVRSRPLSAVRSTAATAPEKEQGLVIPYLSSLSAVYLVVTTVMLLFFLIIAVATLVAVAGAGTGSPAMLIQLLVCLGFVASLAWLLTEVARKRLMNGAVILTPRGVHHRSWAFDSFLSWDQASSVSARELDGQVIAITASGDAVPEFRRRSRTWKQPELKLAPNSIIRTMYLAIDPATAFRIIRYYHTNRAARAELGTESAVRRVHSGSL